MIVVGLTGGVASGKSTVARFFQKKGWKVVDSDRVVRSLLRPGTPEYRKIVRRLGSGVLGRAKRIDRNRLRRIAGRPGVLRVLERILHPGVRRRIRARAKALKRRQGFLLVEVPLLFEAGLDREMDVTIAVSAKPSRQLRYARRRKMSREAFNRFSARQWSQLRKEQKSDFIIRNNGTVNNLKKQTAMISRKLNRFK